MTQEDNMYPNQGDYFGIGEPEDQKAARSLEEAEVFNALPILKKVIEHFEQRIAARDSIKSIGSTLATDPELHQKLCAVNDMTADALREEKEMLEGLIKGYIPE